MNHSFKIFKTDLFDKWLKEQSEATRTRIQIRLDRILVDGYFGQIHFFDGLIELKWKTGLRVYCARVGQTIIVILAGGTKHGQSKDIKKAKKLLQEIKAGPLASS